MTDVWSKLTSIRLIDGKMTKVIVDIFGDIVNRDPTKEELKYLKIYPGIRGILKLQEKEKKKYLLEFLIYFYKKNGRSPTTEDFRTSNKYPGVLTYYRVFESWNNALIEAGLPVNILTNCTDEELLEYLVQFYVENNRPPTKKDFSNNSNYPSSRTYDRFGGWQKALKLVCLDTDSMVRKGVVETYDQKARLAEIFVKEHFIDKDKVIDLSGKNRNSPIDGMCPQGKSYDVKSSKLHYISWIFNIHNINRYEIEWYYLLAFNSNYTDLLHVWRIPAIDFVDNIEKGGIYIGLNSGREHNIENMKQYEITEKFMFTFKNWLNSIQYDKRKYDGCVTYA